MPFSARACAYTPQPSSSKKRDTDVLLVGRSDAGKTALLAALAHARTSPTRTSMQPNLAVLPGRDTKTRLGCIPGHARLCARGLADHLPAARDVLFVVDAATVAHAGPAVAGNLHEVLAAPIALPDARGAPRVGRGEIAVLACSLREKEGDGFADVREWIEGLE